MEKKTFMASSCKVTGDRIRQRLHPSPGLCLMGRGQVWEWESDDDSPSATSNVPLSALPHVRNTSRVW